MSHTTLNFHRVVSASAEVVSRESTDWLKLSFRDEDGGSLEVVVFADTREACEALLASLAPSKEPVAA
jgi:hypothetical protein